MTQLVNLYFASCIFALIHQTEEQDYQKHGPLQQAKDKAQHVSEQKDRNYYYYYVWSEKLYPDAAKETEVFLVF